MASNSALRDVDGVRLDEFLTDLFDDELGTAYDAPLPASAYDAASFAARGTSPIPSVKSSQVSSPRSESRPHEDDSFKSKASSVDLSDSFMSKASTADASALNNSFKERVAVIDEHTQKRPLPTGPRTIVTSSSLLREFAPSLREFAPSLPHEAGESNKRSRTNAPVLGPFTGTSSFNATSQPQPQRPGGMSWPSLQSTAAFVRSLPIVRAFPLLPMPPPTPPMSPPDSTDELDHAKLEQPQPTPPSAAAAKPPATSKSVLKLLLSPAGQCCALFLVLTLSAVVFKMGAETPLIREYLLGASAMGIVLLAFGARAAVRASLVFALLSASVWFILFAIFVPLEVGQEGLEQTRLRVAGFCMISAALGVFVGLQRETIVTTKEKQTFIALHVTLRLVAFAIAGLRTGRIQTCAEMYVIDHTAFLIPALTLTYMCSPRTDAAAALQPSAA